MDALLTLTEVARECNERPHRVKYAVAEYGIEPVQRAGIIRLWSRDQLSEIKSALQRISNRREFAHA